MPNQASIQRLINRGDGIAAKILGSDCAVMRATSATAPAVSIGQSKVYFDAKYDFKSREPNTYGHPLWGALSDRTNFQVGDRLVAPEGTWFIIEMQPLLPTAAVQANATVSVYRPGESDYNPFGDDYHAGNTSGFGRLLCSAWPASMLQGPKGERESSGAIGSPRQPWNAILLPAPPGVLFDVGDLLIDEQGRRWSMSGIELTDAGYRISAAYEGT